MADPVAATPGTVRPKARPDPRPSRLAVGAGAVAVLSVIGAGLVRFPAAEVSPPGEATTGTSAHAVHVKVDRRVRYIRLRPGQKAPPGARVIQEAAPTPRVIVRHITVPVSVPVRRPTARTRQSGGR